MVQNFCPFTKDRCNPESCAMTVEAEHGAAKVCAFVSIAEALNDLVNNIENIPFELERRGAF